jgi:hypothetical protein
MGDTLAHGCRPSLLKPPHFGGSGALPKSTSVIFASSSDMILRDIRLIGQPLQPSSQRRHRRSLQSPLRTHRPNQTPIAAAQGSPRVGRPDLCGARHILCRHRVSPERHQAIRPRPASRSTLGRAAASITTAPAGARSMSGIGGRMLTAGRRGAPTSRSVGPVAPSCGLADRGSPRPFPLSPSPA